MIEGAADTTAGFAMVIIPEDAVARGTTAGPAQATGAFTNMRPNYLHTTSAATQTKAASAAGFVIGAIIAAQFLLLCRPT